MDDAEHDLGHGVKLRWDIDGAGFVWLHPGCRAWSPLRLMPDAMSTGHRLTDGGPANMAALTIAGSLLCPQCHRFHGHIRAGAWHPA